MAPASSILSIFSCCLQRKPTATASGPFVSAYCVGFCAVLTGDGIWAGIQDTGPNEHSHLIPATNDPSPSSPSAYVVDHQRMKERMSHIVRSKEGKMVNVTSHLPFNLHNKKLKSSSRSAMDVSTSASASSSSPSRSASASTSRSARKLKLNRPSLNFTPYTSYAGTGSGNVQGHVGAPLTGGAAVATPVSGHGAGGPSRSSSLASREMFLHEHEHEHEESERWGRRTPILNVRLVQGVPFVPAAAAAGQSARVVGKEADGTGVGSRRGRAKRKDVGVDVDVDDQARANDAEEGERREAQATPRLRDPHPTSSSPPSHSRSAHSSSSCSSSEPSLRSPSPSPFVPKTEADADAAAHPTLCVSPASTASVGGFKLRDAGPLVVSWGD
ncbi:hypothetical protein CVT25_003724 [Psilocybe cyanescens]|uniref:Uncharacterized protein n=1 Tax=Psilocybe cyanescens TaxID=93625 RepID=A0A409XIX8_PSICY|nr:hypothetical protein CVT25_003724 [Psilocybe cyanescens]